MYPTIVTVEYWDEDVQHLQNECALVYAESFASAAEQVENYYGKDIESMKIQMYEEGLFRVNPQCIRNIEEKL